MRFIADFHVHSKFSRATSKNLDLENIYIAARMKGIDVVGTGDFTHPEWRREMRERLEPAEPGLYRLKKEIETACQAHIPDSCQGTTRFVLTSEISNIYKKNGRVRKNHNLILLPDLEAADRFSARLEKIGNIRSDGRPILGLDARNLLEIMLETDPDGFFIPAHIWTPWFSLFGSKSGFDSLDECFEDLTPHIFALETGLSSDPPMNWRVSGLDGLTLISNSDAHSPMKLGREANLFDTGRDYRQIVSAMKTGDPRQFLGTLEFYPEEGKYHLDGHRNCGVRLWPAESKKLEGLCPSCNKPLTLGVSHRVEDLADHPLGRRPEKYHPHHGIVPLTDILSEILKVGPGSKKVQRAYASILKKLGPELPILHSLPLEQLDHAGLAPLKEAIRRVRQGNIEVLGGYDGEFGVVKIFEPGEIETLFGQRSLFDITPSKGRSSKNGPALKPPSPRKKRPKPSPPPKKQETQKTEAPPDRDVLKFNAEQKKAVEQESGPTLITAGPGTGKTHTLAGRIAHLIEKKGVSPDRILAVTFTNKAAAEMRQRLSRLVSGLERFPYATTFHSFCLDVLESGDAPVGDGEKGDEQRLFLLDEDERKSLVADAVALVKDRGVVLGSGPGRFADGIARAKQNLLSPEDSLETAARGIYPGELSSVYRAYMDILSSQGLYDYEDLIFETHRRFQSDSDLRQRYAHRFAYIFVDECQDLNLAQYRLIRLLAPPDKPLFLIGDPDQAIYGFRGSDPVYLKTFLEDYPHASVRSLVKNYRSAAAILDASFQVMEKARFDASAPRIYSNIQGMDAIGIIETETEKAEAEGVAATIERMTGGASFFSFDSRRVDPSSDLAPGSGNRGFSDFAVLFRTTAQGEIIKKALDRSGMPCRLSSKRDRFFKKELGGLMTLFKIINDCGPAADMTPLFRQTQSGVGPKTVAAFNAWRYKNGLTLPLAMKQARRFPVPGVGKAAQYKLAAFFDGVESIKKEAGRASAADQLEYLGRFLKIEAAAKKNPEIEKGFLRLMDIAGKKGAPPRRFLQQLALETDSDVSEPGVETISLMTMHASKGLEFPVVFIVGCENGLIPFHLGGSDSGNRDVKPGGDPDFNMDEERRLFYVAMTRAKQELYLSFAKRRTVYGKTGPRSLSLFVSDIEDGLQKPVDVFQGKKRAPRQIQQTLF